MRKKLILLASLLLLGSSLVFSDTATFRFNYSIPRVSSDLWEEEFSLMDFDKSDFQATGIGFSYEYFLRREISFRISIDPYTKKKLGTYEGLVGEVIEGEEWAFDYGEGFAIEHSFDVSITPIQLSVKLTPLGRRERFIPYLGAGVGLYLWSVRLLGDWVIFSEGEWFYDPNIDADVMGYPIYIADVRDETEISFGYHAFGGMMFLVSNRLSIDIELKFNSAKGNLKDFEGFEPFDLSAYQLSLGMSYWF